MPTNCIPFTVRNILLYLLDGTVNDPRAGLKKKISVPAATKIVQPATSGYVIVRTL
jgi:hypothetical protein